MIVSHQSTCRLVVLDARARVAFALIFSAGCSPMVSEERPRISLSGTTLEAEATVDVPTARIDPAPQPENREASEEAQAPDQFPYPTVPRTGAPGTTKGTISCGSLRCDATTHHCDWDGKKGHWACVSQNESPAFDSFDETRPNLARCDDASDCASAERCCRLDPTGLGRQCLPRSEVDLCAREVCLEGGTPCAGGTCDRSPSDTEWSDENGIEGVCRAPAGRATCANKVRCTLAQPVCAQIWKQEAPPRCVSSKADMMVMGSVLRFSCTRQGDCNGEDSCMFGMRAQSAFCGRWQRDSGNALVCDPAARCLDCRPMPNYNVSVALTSRVARSYGAFRERNFRGWEYWRTCRAKPTSRPAEPTRPERAAVKGGATCCPVGVFALPPLWAMTHWLDRMVA